MEFYFRLNGTVVRERLRTQKPLNKGDWHFVLIEHDPYNLRLTLDTARVLVWLDTSVKRAVDFSGDLYLGGMPQE